MSTTFIFWGLENGLRWRFTKTSIVLPALMVVCITGAIGELCLGSTVAASYGITWGSDIVHWVGDRVGIRTDIIIGGTRWAGD